MAKKWKVWPWVAWAATSLGVFAILEWWGLRKAGDEYPPLTHVIRKYVPRWLFFTGFGGFAIWFLFHIAGLA
jgi:hypothetical protein